MLEVESQSLSEKDQGAITEKLDTNSSQPTVTIGIPVLNEEEHIERVVSGFLDAGYPNLVEILIADGGSKDRTREIVAKLSEKDSRVKLLDNPEKYQSFALNRMIEIAEGEFFLRVDGHCFYAKDYIHKNVEVFRANDVRNVGGAQRYMATNLVQAGTSIAVKSFLGNGGAKYMREKYEGYADTVFLGCFRTNDLREVGGFNTENITNEDSELNLRLIERYGSSIFISPYIRSWYSPRETYMKLFKQYFRYGRGRFLTKALHPASGSIRGVLPFLFLFLLISYFVIDLVVEKDLYFMELMSILGVILIVEITRAYFVSRSLFEKEIWKGESKKPSAINLVLSAIICIVIMQVAHFSGFLFQLVKVVIGAKRDW